jgi:hypothetical protein
MVERLFRNLGNLLKIASACKKPDQKAFAALLTDLQTDIDTIIQHKDNNRKERDWFDHLSMIAAGVPCMAWVTMVSFAYQSRSPCLHACDVTGEQAWPFH